MRSRVKKEEIRSAVVKSSYRVALVVSITTVWASMLSPLIIGYFARPSLENVSRPYFDILNHSIGYNQTRLAPNAYNFSNGSGDFACPSLFVFNSHMCVPICGLWHPFGEDYFKAYRATTIITSIIELLSALVGFIIFIRVPGSVKFPRIIYLFMFLTLIGLSAVLSVAAIAGPHVFFCGGRNEDYNIVAQNTPIQVSIFGVISHYSFTAFNFSFFVAALNIFLHIQFPHSQIFKSVKRKRVLIVIEIIIALGIPAIFPILTIGLYQQYSFVRLPLLPFPLANRIAPFIMVIAPLIMLTGLVLTLITITIYRVQINRYLLTYREIVRFKSYEIRLIIFAIQVFFTTFFIFTEISYSFATNEISDILQEEFFACETLLYNPGILKNQSQAPTLCDTAYKSYMHPVFAIIADMATGIAAVQVTVILTTSVTKKAWAQSFKSIFTVLSDVTSSSATAPN